MKFEMAATDAGQSPNPHHREQMTPRNVPGLAPFAARLEVTPWITTEFEVTIKVAQASRLRVRRVSRSAVVQAARRRPNSQPRTAALRSAFEEERARQQTDLTT